MRASRLISVLLLLQSRGRMTAQQLADELEVSVRTVYRDVEELSASGIPVYADRGAHGGFQLVEGYRTRLTGLTPQEAEALFLSGYPGPAAELGLGTVLAAAQLKVLAALPPELRSRASRIRQRFHLDAPGWFSEPEVAPYLQQIAEAVWSDRRLQMRYRRGGDDQIVDRLVDPLGVVLKAGVWYLVARSADEFRTYRISRIVELTISGERFARPDDFDLAEHWDRSVTAYESSLPSFQATVRVREESLWRVYELVGRMRAREAIDAGARDEPGWLTLTLPLGDMGYAASQVLTFGPDLEVVAPGELRAMVASRAREMALLYA
jgi:predicted DNA-binding transcriptional regulator YafY